MSFLEHLDELRSRLFKCALVFVATFAVAWAFSDRLLNLLLAPIRQHLFEGGEIVFIQITEPFTIKDLSAATGVKGADIVKRLFMQGIMATIIDSIDRINITVSGIGSVTKYLQINSGPGLFNYSRIFQRQVF